MTTPQILLILLTLGNWFLFGGFAISSLKEREYRAAWISLGFTFFLSLALILPVFFSTPLQWAILGVVLGIVLLFSIAFFLPIGKITLTEQHPDTRFDERRIVFSRNNLQPGSNNYAEYYASHPEDEPGDEISRNNPGLLSQGSLFYEAPAFIAADAMFEAIAHLRQMDAGPIAAQTQNLPTEEASVYVKHLAKYLGALDVGICLLNPSYIYTHAGRDEEKYGQPIELKHKYAIAMTFEMDREMISTTPRPPGVVESAHQYMRGAIVSLQLAEAIRKLGYPAAAHFDGHYQVIAPPIARDAGLGEIGRMSLLMTPKQGPRVRLAMVTTDLPMITDPSKPNGAVIDFCNICKKCALSCPSKSIPFNEMQVKNRTLRWTINAESCYRYWTRVGTDCGVCLRVCPYAHADSYHHNVIRWGIQHSGFFRRAALVMDNIFYGKNPTPSQMQDWPISKTTH